MPPAMSCYTCVNYGSFPKPAIVVFLRAVVFAGGGMSEILTAALVAAFVAVPASASNTLNLVCQGQKIPVNGAERSCAGQSDRIAVIDLDAGTL